MFQRAHEMFFKLLLTVILFLISEASSAGGKVFSTFGMCLLIPYLCDHSFEIFTSHSETNEFKRTFSM